MAGRSQHTIQIMATQTCFDLTAAIESWRNELAAQSQLTSDNRRELERHFADSIAELRGRGLNEEESFWLAEKRMGQPQQLAEEFVKADPAKIWRERAFWMVLGLLAFSLWQALVDMYLRYYREEVAVFHVRRFLLVYVLPAIVFLLVQRWAVKSVTVFCAFFKNRWRFAVTMIAFMVAINGPQELEAYQFRIQMVSRLQGHVFWLNQFSYIGFPLTLLAVAIWLLPTQKQSSRKEKPV
jgi:hypothetical protein